MARLPPVEGIEVVLQDDRDAMQPTDGVSCCVLAVQVRCDVQGVRVDGNDGMQGRSLPVIGLDALEVAFDQAAAGERPLRECGVDAVDGGFFKHEGGRWFGGWLHGFSGL
jgi:hypothetical protein